MTAPRVSENNNVHGSLASAGRHSLFRCSVAVMELLRFGNMMLPAGSIHSDIQALTAL
jgi:hypothetical protein